MTWQGPPQVLDLSVPSCRHTPPGRCRGSCRAVMPGEARPGQQAGDVASTWGRRVAVREGVSAGGDQPGHRVRDFRAIGCGA
jgi:hypothetical protein